MRYLGAFRPFRLLSGRRFSSHVTRPSSVTAARGQSTVLLSASVSIASRSNFGNGPMIRLGFSIVRFATTAVTVSAQTAAFVYHGMNQSLISGWGSSLSTNLLFLSVLSRDTLSSMDESHRRLLEQPVKLGVVCAFYKFKASASGLSVQEFLKNATGFALTEAVALVWSY